MERYLYCGVINMYLYCDLFLVIFFTFIYHGICFQRNYCCEPQYDEDVSNDFAQVTHCCLLKSPVYVLLKSPFQIAQITHCCLPLLHIATKFSITITSFYILNHCHIILHSQSLSHHFTFSITVTSFYILNHHHIILHSQSLSHHFTF